MIFDIDADIALDAVAGALEEAGIQMSLEQFEKVVEAIDEGMPGVIEVLTYGMQEYWQSEASKTSRWGKFYAQAIKVEYDGDTGRIFLDEESQAKGTKITNFIFAMMVEGGVKSWSIKKALLASDKAKVSSTGIRYMIVPFPVAVPRRSNQGTMQSRFGRREMTAEMHKIVKAGGKLKTGTLSPYGKEIDVSGLSKWTTRQFHEQYGIFRCVSEKSEGWQYPNIAEEPVYPAVLEEVNRQIQKVLTEFCREIVKEYSQ